MSTPERIIFESEETGAYNLITPDIDPLEMALTAIQKLKKACLPTYIPADFEVEAAERGAEAVVIKLDKFRPSIPMTEDDISIPSSQDPLRLKLVEERRARNAEPDSYSSVKPQPQPAEYSRERLATIRPAESSDVLFMRLEQGDQRAAARLVEDFIPLARKLARKYTGGSEPLEDLEQVANLGLLKAVQRFKRDQGFAFSSFAVPTIEGELKRYFRDHGWGTHVVRGLQEKALAVQKTMNKLEQNGQEATLQQVAETLELSYGEALEAWLVMQEGYRLPSLDKPVGNGNENDETITLGDITSGSEGEDSIIDRVAHRIELERILAHVSPRDKEIFVRHILLDQTQKETAAAVGVSQMQVSRIVRRIKEGKYYNPPTQQQSKSDPSALPQPITTNVLPAPTEDGQPQPPAGSESKPSETPSSRATDSPKLQRPKVSLEMLAKRAKLGDNHAVQELMNRCELIARSIVAKTEYYLPDGDDDDLCQSGLLGIARSYNDHDPSKGSFFSFAYMVIRRNMITAIIASRRNKHKALNEATSLDAPLTPADPNSALLGEIIPKVRSCMDEVLSDREAIKELVGHLSGLERSTMELYIQGYSYDEIGSSIGLDAKVVDNALQRIKRKLSNSLAA